MRPSGIVLILPYKVECSRQGKKLAFDFLKRALVGAGGSAVGGMRVLRGPRSRWLRSAPLRRRSSEPPTILSPTSQWAHRSGSRQHVTGSSASSGSTPQRQPPPSASRCVQRARPPAFVAPGYQNVHLLLPPTRPQSRSRFTKPCRRLLPNHQQLRLSRLLSISETAIVHCCSRPGCRSPV